MDIEPLAKVILGIRISFETTILVVAERFRKDSVRKYGRHPLSTDDRTWYTQARIFLDIEHHIYSIYEKHIIERTIQYIKDRTESFDDYFPCRKEMNCKLEHIINWLDLLKNMQSKMIINNVA